MNENCVYSQLWIRLRIDLERKHKEFQNETRTERNARTVEWIKIVNESIKRDARYGEIQNDINLNTKQTHRKIN